MSSSCSPNPGTPRKDGRWGSGSNLSHSCPSTIFFSVTHVLFWLPFLGNGGVNVTAGPREEGRSEATMRADEGKGKKSRAREEVSVKRVSCSVGRL